MLQFGRGALAAWREQIHETYPERLLAFLRQQLPEHDDEQLPGRRDVAMARAVEWELFDEQSMTTYAVLFVSHGPTFDEQRWSRPILQDSNMPPPRRIELVYEVAVRRATVAGGPLADREARDDA